MSDDFSGTAGGDTGGSLPSGGSGSASPAGTPPSAPSSGAGSLTQPGSQGTTNPDRQPVDFSRFEEVNTRAQRTAWAEAYEPDEVEQATNLYRWFDQDPEGAYDYVTGLLTRGGHLKNRGTGQQTQPPVNGGRQPSTPGPTLADGRPGPDIFIQETGQRLYSADQAARMVDWAMDRMEQRLKPVESFVGHTTAENEARQTAQSMIREAETNWPYFNDFAAEIHKELKRDGRATLESAYRRVAIPKIRERERATMAQELRDRHAAGSGGHNPGQVAPATTVELRKLPMKELFRREMVRRGIGR
jgi:hypothetical protein